MVFNFLFCNQQHNWRFSFHSWSKKISKLCKTFLLCFLFFVFFLLKHPFKQSTLLWETSQIVCIRFKTRLFSYGYGIRYEYGIFTQKIKGTEQVSILWFCFLTPFLNLMNILQSIYIALIIFYKHLSWLRICAKHFVLSPKDVFLGVIEFLLWDPSPHRQKAAIAFGTKSTLFTDCIWQLRLPAEGRRM